MSWRLCAHHTPCHLGRRGLTVQADPRFSPARPLPPSASDILGTVCACLHFTAFSSPDPSPLQSWGLCGGGGGAQRLWLPLEPRTRGPALQPLPTPAPPPRPWQVLESQVPGPPLMVTCLLCSR